MSAAVTPARRLALALVLAGGVLSASMCADAWLSSASAESISDKLNSWFFGAPATDNNTSTPNTPAEIDCPGVTVREGAATLAINAPGGEPTPMNVRYQVSIGQTARECAALGGVMTMKVGVQGRVLLGPVGEAGSLDVPLRIAVVQEGADPKTIVSKFYHVAVAVPPGQTSVTFTQVEQDLTFPMPRPSALEAYVVYVGFDPSSAPARPVRKTKAKRK